MCDHIGRKNNGNGMQQDFGHFVALLPFYEGGAVWNALNTSLTIFVGANSTINAYGMSTLWCPSDDVAGLHAPNDPVVDPTGWDDAYQPMTYSSYAGNLGTRPYRYEDPKLGQSDGVFAHNGGTVTNPGGGTYGWSGHFAPTTIASITDGTSNTILYGEHAHSKIAQSDPGDYYGANWWSSGDWGDTTFSSIFPPNYFKSLAQEQLAVKNGTLTEKFPTNNNFKMTAASNHPGGANFAFCDGSVRFIKDSVNSWSPSAISGSGNTKGWTYVTTQPQGVFQSLSTKAGGEVISSDAY